MEKDGKLQTIGVVVFNADDPTKVCLVEQLEGSDHLNGVHGLISGKIEDGETPAQAAARELGEEAGLETTASDMIQVGEFYAEIPQKDGLKRMDWYVFWCIRYSGALKTSDETIPQWIAIEDVATIENLLPNIENAVALAVKRRDEGQREQQ